MHAAVYLYIYIYVYVDEHTYIYCGRTYIQIFHLVDMHILCMSIHTFLLRLNIFSTVVPRPHEVRRVSRLYVHRLRLSHTIHPCGDHLGPKATGTLPHPHTLAAAFVPLVLSIAEALKAHNNDTTRHTQNASFILGFLPRGRSRKQEHSLPSNLAPHYMVVYSTFARSWIRRNPF